jgi:hypothetical protein
LFDERDNTDSVLSPVGSEATSEPSIKKVIVREGKLLFVVGFNSPLWVHYKQVKDSARVELFLKELTDSEWEEFILERETEVIEAGSLELDGC